MKHKFIYYSGWPRKKHAQTPKTHNSWHNSPKIYYLCSSFESSTLEIEGKKLHSQVIYNTSWYPSVARWICLYFYFVTNLNKKWQNMKIIISNYHIRNQHTRNTKNGNFHENLIHFSFWAQITPIVPQKGAKYKNYQFWLKYS